MRPLNRPRLDEQQIVVGRIDVGPLKRLNRPRPKGLQTVVVQGGIEVACITLGNYHVEPQSCEARLWLVNVKTDKYYNMCLSQQDSDNYVCSRSPGHQNNIIKAPKQHV